MIHRAILGSFERFIGILTEHFAGEFPLFLAPLQVIIVPISSVHSDYAYKLRDNLIDMDIDVEVYDKSESLNKRIRTAEKQRVPFVLVVGDREAKEGSVAIRDRRKKEQYNLKFEDFMVELSKQLNEGKI